MSTRSQIEVHLAAAGGPLTYAELAELTGKSLSTVAHHIKRMRKDGVVPRTRKRRKLSLVADHLRPAVARDRCALLVEQLAAATTMDEASACYDGLVELLDILEAMAA